jgi:hypothetical protein
MPLMEMKQEYKSVPTTHWTRTNFAAPAAVNSKLRPEVGTAQSHKWIERYVISSR